MNPYFAFAISFLVALAFYAFGWSALYPPITSSLVIFLSISILSMTGMGIFWRRLAPLKHVTLPTDDRAMLITIFIYILWTAEFFYEGGIPLVKILLAQPYDYRLFGIPTLHVFTVTFSSFYTIYLFHSYLLTHKRKFLVLYVINLAAALLIFNRGMLIFNVTGTFLILLSHLTVTWRFFLILTPIIILSSFLFGILGNLRTAQAANKDYDSSLFIGIGDASPAFENSFIPNEFFWTYIYISSPLANLQENINYAEQKPLTWSNLFAMANSEMILDFISKRVNAAFNLTPPMDHRIVGPFNVSTVFSVSYSYLNWAGVILMTVYLLIIPIIYFNLFPPVSPYFPTGVAILTTMYLFLAFDNMISFTGLSFQLAYPLLFSWLEVKGLLSLRKN